MSNYFKSSFKEKIQIRSPGEFQREVLGEFPQEFTSFMDTSSYNSSSFKYREEEGLQHIIKQVEKHSVRYIDHRLEDIAKSILKDLGSRMVSCIEDEVESYSDNYLTPDLEKKMQILIQLNIKNAIEELKRIADGSPWERVLNFELKF